jgi:DNA-binding NarL/FixJ family response regulator
MKSVLPTLQTRPQIIVLNSINLVTSAMCEAIDEVFPTAELRVFQSAIEAVEGLKAAPACLALLDTQTQDRDGLDHIPEIIQSGRARHVIVSLGRTNERTEWQLRAARVAGVFDGLSASRKSFRDGLRDFVAGRRCLCDSMSRLISRGPVSFDPNCLTHTQEIVLSVLGEGMDNIEAGLQLGCSSETIRTHRTHIMCKLGLHRERELIRYAILHLYIRYTHSGNILHPGFERELSKLKKETLA